MPRTLWMLAACWMGTAAWAAPTCMTASDGLTDRKGQPLAQGFDRWGYNYEDRVFSGSYADLLRGDGKLSPFADVQLEMRWNETWLSAKDCDGDGKLDRHRGAKTYRGTDAELITRKWRNYIDAAGNECRWEQFTVFKAAPADAELRHGMWINPQGEVLGPRVWGAFVVVDEFLEDSCGHDTTDTGFY